MFDLARRQLAAMAKRTTPADGPSVRDLQRAAASARRSKRTRGVDDLSRSAQLQLIDDLSRSGDAGIAVLVGASALMAVTFGAAAPGRAALWMALVFATAYAAGRLRRTFRRGEKIAGKPFRWRANYTASLAALSAAVGAGAILLNPADPTLPDAAGAILTIALAAPVAAWFHRAHRVTVLTTAAPAMAFVGLAAARETASAPAMAAAAAAIAAAGLILALAASTRAMQAAALAHPPTRMPRRRNDDGRRDLSATLSGAGSDGAARA
ncbi:MAG: hypothetical protein GC152_10365 [Alphaproteobacteria bacterium]|nr:hypothetical protein [Alphaproteobacteria bacterium]